MPSTVDQRRVFPSPEYWKKVVFLYILEKKKLFGTVQVSKNNMQRSCVCIKPKSDLRQ